VICRFDCETADC